MYFSADNHGYETVWVNVRFQVSMWSYIHYFQLERQKAEVWRVQPLVYQFSKCVLQVYEFFVITGRLLRLPKSLKDFQGLCYAKYTDAVVLSTFHSYQSLLAQTFYGEQCINCYAF